MSAKPKVLRIVPVGSDDSARPTPTPLPRSSSMTGLASIARSLGDHTQYIEALKHQIERQEQVIDAQMETLIQLQATLDDVING